MLLRVFIIIIIAFTGVTSPLFAQEKEKEYTDSLCSRAASIIQTQPSEALKIMMEVLTLEEQLYGANHKYYGNSLMMTGICYKQLGRYAEALEYMSRALEITMRTDGRLSRPAGERNYHLADLYLAMNQLDKAMYHGAEALDIIRDTQGADCSDYIVTAYLQSRIYHRAGQLAAALPLTLAVMDYYTKRGEDKSLFFAGLLTNASLSSAAIGQKDKALEYALQAHEIYRMTDGPESERYASGCAFLARCYTALGHWPEAIDLVNQQIEVLAKLHRTGTMHYGVALQNLGAYQLKNSEYEASIDTSLKALEALKSTGEDVSANEADIYSTMGMAAKEMRIFEQAAQYYSHALTTGERVWGKLNLQYAAVLANSAMVLPHLGQYDVAKERTLQAIEIYKTLGREDSRSYSRLLQSMAVICTDLETYDEAEEYLNQALAVSGDRQDRTDILRNIGRNLSAQQRFGEALGYYEEALTIAQESGNSDLAHLASIYGGLGTVYHGLMHWKRGREYALKALEAYQQCGKDDTDLYFNQLRNIGAMYLREMNYEKAHEYLTLANDKIGQKYGDSSPEYSYSLIDLANAETNLGMYTPALAHSQQAIELNLKLMGASHSDYLQAMLAKAKVLRRIGDYEAALEIVGQIKETLQATQRVNELYTIVVSEERVLRNSLGDYQGALTACREELEMLKESGQADSLNEASVLNTMADILASMNRLQESLELAQKAVDIVNECGENLPQAYYTYNTLAYILYRLDKHELAKQASLHAMEVAKTAFGVESSEYLLSLRNQLSYIFEAQNVSEDAFSITQLVTDRMRDMILSRFPGLTISERTNLWSKFSDWFTRQLPQMTVMAASPRMAKTLYDGQLFSKGILLNTEVEMRRALAQASDSVSLAMFDEMRALNATLSSAPASMRDSLANRRTQIYRQLSLRSLIFADYADNLRINSDDVRKCLKDGDVAIEFVHVPLAPDSVGYIALVLRKDLPNPIMIPLGYESDISSLRKKYRNSPQYYQALSSLVWGPLMQYIQGQTRVYFAPSGQLHVLPIEFLPIPGSERLLAESFRMSRLSSTRALTAKTEKNVTSESGRHLIFGGIKYDAQIDQMPHSITEKNTPLSTPTRYISENLRGGVAELPASKVEAEDIFKLLNSHKINTLLFTGSKASEDAIKRELAFPVKLLHIATHGFYWTPSEAELNMHSFIHAHPTSETIAEDKQLARSGLLMAGANLTLQGLPLPQKVEDGVLTAREIAALDFRATNLVVLSACQTGLGDISAEGVFGLQRGFKKGGAGALLMSLWKVDDNATRLLMTEFYRQLYSGLTKYDALIRAQQFVRNYSTSNGDNQPYNDPKYWSAFVLLDALE